jgi:hypothetical protein
MTGLLIRRDPALPTLLKILPFALVHGYTLSGRTALPLFMSVGVSWALIIAHLGFSRADERCGEFAMALPMPARRLWLLRTGLLAGTSVLLIAAAGAVARAPVFVSLGACVLLAVVWLQSWAPGKNVLSGFGFWVWAKVGVAGAIGLSVWLARQSAWLALAPLGAAALLAARTWVAAPRSFELDRSAGARLAEEILPTEGGTGRWKVPVSRLFFEWYWWLLFPLFFYVGRMSASEGALPIMMLLAATPLASVLVKRPQLAHLPISDRRLFAWATLPALGAYLAGLLLGWLINGPPRVHPLLLVHEPGGPETLRWVQLRVDLRMGAVLAVAGGLMWLGMVVLQVGKLYTPALTRRAGWRQRLKWSCALAGCLLVLPVIGLFTTEPSDFGKPAEAVAYYTALGLVRVAGVFPTGWSAVVAAVAALIGIYWWGERSFRQAEALTPRSGLL